MFSRLLASQPATAAAAKAQIERCTPAESASLDAGLSYSAKADVPAQLNEFGDSTNDVDNALMVDLADQRFLSWTYWQYNSTGASLAPGLLVDDSKHGSQANARQGLLDALVVPYPQAVSGTPTSYQYDRAAKSMKFSYSTRRVVGDTACVAPTSIFIPHRTYPQGYRAQVTGARVVSKASSAWLELESLPGATTATVTVAPDSAGSVAIPTVARDASDAGRATCLVASAPDQAQPKSATNSSKARSDAGLYLGVGAAAVVVAAAAVTVGLRHRRRRR